MSEPDASSSNEHRKAFLEEFWKEKYYYVNRFWDNIDIKSECEHSGLSDVSDSANSASKRRSDVADVGQRLESLKLEERNILPTEQKLEEEFKESFMEGDISSKLLYEYFGEANEEKRAKFLEWFPFLHDVEPLLTKYVDNYKEDLKGTDRVMNL